MLLAQEVHSCGIKVALTGEGADEWLAGYPWYKVHKLLGCLDAIPGLRLATGMRRLFLKLTGAPAIPREWMRRSLEAAGGPNPWLDIYGLVSIAKMRFFGPELREVMADHNPYADVGLNQERMRRWHPLNRGLYLGARIHLPGLLLNAKGDRVAMHSSVETRYPFLDEKVYALARGHSSALEDARAWATNICCACWLSAICPRRSPGGAKRCSAHRSTAFTSPSPPHSSSSFSARNRLRRTGYFDAKAVTHWRKAFKGMRARSTQRLSIEMGLAGVLSTQLWHHLHVDASLADLPSKSFLPSKMPA